MVNYNNSKIYKITSIHTEECYVGSTTAKRLCQRLAEHKSKYKRYLNGKDKGTYTAFKILKYGDYRIELIETYPCNSKDELHKKEREYIKSLNCVNKSIPLRTRKEHYKDNREKELKYSKERYQLVKDKKNKKYNCPCGGRYASFNKKPHLKTKKHLKYLGNI